MTTFGDRLRQVREARDWSQEKLGFEVEVSKATVSKWENNRAEPGLKHLSSLRRVFADDNMTLDWLIDDAVSAKNMVISYRRIADGSATYLPSPRLVESAEELAMLTRFRRLGRKQQRAFIDLMGPTPSDEG